MRVKMAGESHSKVIVLVSCVKSKHDRPMAACDIYKSPLFRGSRRYAEANGDAWYILSAEHGVLSPDTVIAPYEKTLSRGRMSKLEQQDWAEKVQDQLGVLIPQGACIHLLAGKDYYKNLLGFLGQRRCDITIPMDGMKQGFRLKWLKSQGYL